MFAQVRPVGAGAGFVDLGGFRENAVCGVGDDAHHAVGKLSAKQLDERINLACALPFDRLPFLWRQRIDRELDFVERTSHDERADLARPNLEIKHGAVAGIRATARETIREIAEGLHVIALVPLLHEAMNHLPATSASPDPRRIPFQKR